MPGWNQVSVYKWERPWGEITLNVERCDVDGRDGYKWIVRDRCNKVTLIPYNVVWSHKTLSGAQRKAEAVADRWSTS